MFTDHNKILPTLHCRNVCKISLWLDEYEQEQYKVLFNFEIDGDIVTGKGARFRFLEFLLVKEYLQWCND